MKKIISGSFIFIFVFAMVFSGKAVAQESKDKSASMEKAKEWLNKGEWANGLNLKVHKSVNIMEFSDQYHRNKALWDVAFDYLKNTDLEGITPGKYNLDGNNVYVIVSDGQTKAFEDTKWESHRNYVDIQYVVRGTEKMGIAPLSKARVTEAYNESKDIAFHSVPESDSQYYKAQPGTFLIFFPQDAHRPSIKTDGCETDKKVVIKIRTAAE